MKQILHCDWLPECRVGLSSLLKISHNFPTRIQDFIGHIRLALLKLRINLAWSHWECCSPWMVQCMLQYFCQVTLAICQYPFICENWPRPWHIPTRTCIIPKYLFKHVSPKIKHMMKTNKLCVWEHILWINAGHFSSKTCRTWWKG